MDFKTTFKNFVKVNKDRINYVRDFVTMMLIYGTILTIPVCVLVESIRFNLLLIPALGITFYFIKEELPTIIRKLK